MLCPIFLDYIRLLKIKATCADSAIALILAGVEGIEPSLKVLETSVMPFDHTPKFAELVVLRR